MDKETDIDKKTFVRTFPGGTLRIGDGPPNDNSALLIPVQSITLEIMPREIRPRPDGELGPSDARGRVIQGCLPAEITGTIASLTLPLSLLPKPETGTN